RLRAARLGRPPGDRGGQGHGSARDVPGRRHADIGGRAGRPRPPRLPAGGDLPPVTNLAATPPGSPGLTGAHRGGPRSGGPCPASGVPDGEGVGEGVGKGTGPDSQGGVGPSVGLGFGDGVAVGVTGGAPAGVTGDGDGEGESVGRRLEGAGSRNPPSEEGATGGANGEAGTVARAPFM